MACALSYNIEITVWRESCKFVLVSLAWLLIHTFDIRGWEQKRENFKGLRIYRCRELQLLPVEPQIALWVPMVASPHLLPFLVKTDLVIAEVCLSAPWALQFFFAAGRGGQPEQHSGMQLKVSLSEGAGRCQTLGRCFAKPTHPFCKWETDQKPQHPLQEQHNMLL